MKREMIIYVFGLSIYMILIPFRSITQNLEVTGQAKITEMSTDNSAQNVVVRQPDGILAVRDASTLSGQSTGNYGTVVNPITGKVWLDRNLGAAQVATSSTDVSSYGDLYQWGRGADGHQVRTSSTTTFQATTWLAGWNGGLWDGSFIIQFPNWLSTGETDMWSGTEAENNPCPSGFRVPTNAEWEQERLTWSSNDAAGAFASSLKLPTAGYRILTDGALTSVGSLGLYWSSTADGSGARRLTFSNSSANMDALGRAGGFSIRCIMD